MRPPVPASSIQSPPCYAFECIAMQVPVRDASIATAESIDFIVQIHILQEVRRVTDIARVERELRNGRPWGTPVFRFDETSPVDAPRWERMSAAEAEGE